MELIELLRDMTEGEREAFAKKIARKLRSRTSVGYLYLLAGGHRKPSPKLALAIEELSGGEVSREVLLPKVYPPATARRVNSAATAGR